MLLTNRLEKTKKVTDFGTLFWSCFSSKLRVQKMRVPHKDVHRHGRDAAYTPPYKKGSKGSGRQEGGCGLVYYSFCIYRFFL